MAAAAVHLLPPAVGELLFPFWKEMLCCDGSFRQISKAKTPAPPRHTRGAQTGSSPLSYPSTAPKVLLKVCSKAARQEGVHEHEHEHEHEYEHSPV